MLSKSIALYMYLHACNPILIYWANIGLFHHLVVLELHPFILYAY